MSQVSRLIHTFIPSHYDLSLDIEREARQFTGLVSIHGNAKESTATFHAKDLSVQSVIANGKTVAFKQEDEEIKVECGVGEQLIVIEFSGTITDPMHGLYPCYFEHDGKKKELLATQFESHHAREVFPCIDEPEAKATFSLTLTTEKNVTVLSNMPAILQREEHGKLLTKFDTTPRMSSYLLAWVVGELQSKTSATKDGVEVSVWSTLAQPSDSLDFALQESIKVIEFYDDYFGTPYPLAKCDHVALPDFSSGAMENWGLITYRETCLLADPKITSVSGKRYIAEVIAHELAHQWFGNLVTMKWWDDLWLNESFATMMANLALDNLHPDWDMWLEFSSTEVISALERDAIDGVQAVKVDVNHPDEISSLFDPSIVYAKGARLLRMLQHFIGDKKFQAGLKKYFSTYAYNNTVGDNLWDAIGDDTKEMMNSWISQSGYPIISVTKSHNTVELTQKQFHIGPHEPSSKLWDIPLNTDNPAFPKLLKEKKIKVTTDTPFRLNIDDTAHFITHYDDAVFADILASLQTLPPVDRLAILHEAILMSRTNIKPSSDLIDLLNVYAGEKNEQVFGMISRAIGELKKFVDSDATAEKKLRSFAGRLTGPQYERLGINKKPNESDDDTKLRATVIGLMLYSESPEVIEAVKTVYHTTNVDDIDPEVRPIILSGVVRHSNPEVVDDLMKLHQSTHSSELQDDICSGVTSTKSPEKIHELLESIKDPKIIRPQDSFRWFAYLIRGKESREVAWQWLQKNWTWIDKTYGSDKSFDYFPRFASSALRTPQELQEYIDFFEPKTTIPALTRVITVGISELKGRVELIEQDSKAVCLKLNNLI